MPDPHLPAGGSAGVHVHRSDEDRANCFRTLRPRNGQSPQGVCSFAETEGEDEPCKTVDLAASAHLELGGRDPA